MKSFSPLTDEHTVVAFLSGLDEQRDEAALYLACSPTARELLCMAQEALEALDLPSAPPSPILEKHHAEA